METLQEARAELIRQQAENLKLSKALGATPMGTCEWGQLRARLQQSGQDVKAAQQRMNSLIKGSQSSLL